MGGEFCAPKSGEGPAIIRALVEARHIELHNIDYINHVDRARESTNFIFRKEGKLNQNSDLYYPLY